MDNNLISLKKLQADIKIMKLISILLKPDQRKQQKDMEKQLETRLPKQLRSMIDFPLVVGVHTIV